MVKSESLCLPFCGKNLSLANPNEEPGYDAFEKIVGETFLTKLNSFIIKRIGTKVYTQLDEKEQNMDGKELESQETLVDLPANERPQLSTFSTSPEKQQNDNFSYLREVMEDGNNFTDIVHHPDLLPENITKREIEALSKNLMLERNQIGNIEAPFYGKGQIQKLTKAGKPRKKYQRRKNKDSKLEEIKPMDETSSDRSESPREINENRSKESSPSEIPMMNREDLFRTDAMAVPRINFSLTEFLDIRSPTKMKRHSPDNNNKQMSVTAQLPSFPTQKMDNNSNDSNTLDENLSTYNQPMIVPENQNEIPTECNTKQKVENENSSGMIQTEESNEGQSAPTLMETDVETSLQAPQAYMSQLQSALENQQQPLSDSNNTEPYMNHDFFASQQQQQQQQTIEYNNILQDINQMYALMSQQPGFQYQDFANAYYNQFFYNTCQTQMQMLPESGANLSSQYTPFQTIATPIIHQEIDQGRVADLETMTTNVNELLGTVDMTNDLFSNTLLKNCPEKRKGRSKKEDYSEERLEEVAAACLPDAFDLWKEKYRTLVIEEYPNASRKEVDDRLTEIWCRLPDMHRRRYFVKAEKLARRYNSTAAFSYMNRFKNKHPAHRYNEPNVPNDSNRVHCPTPIRTTPKGTPDKTTEHENDSQKSSDSDENSNDSLTNSNDFDYKNALKETQTYNSPVKKALTKKLNQRQKQQEEIQSGSTTKTIKNSGGGLNLPDESIFATGVLMDIMMTDGDSSQQIKDDESTPQLKPSSWSPTEMMSELTTLDISALDDYLTGTDTSFIDESSSNASGKKKRRPYKRKIGKEKKTKAKKTKD